MYFSTICYLSRQPEQFNRPSDQATGRKIQSLLVGRGQRNSPCRTYEDQTGAKSSTLSVGSGGIFLASKAVGVYSWQLTSIVPRSRLDIAVHIYSPYTVYRHHIRCLKITFTFTFCQSFTLTSADVSVLRWPFPMTQISRKAFRDGY